MGQFTNIGYGNMVVIDHMAPGTSPILPRTAAEGSVTTTATQTTVR